MFLFNDVGDCVIDSCTQMKKYFIEKNKLMKQKIRVKGRKIIAGFIDCIYVTAANEEPENTGRRICFITDDGTQSFLL